MAKLIKKIFNYWMRCPNCGSMDTTLLKDEASCGCNYLVCNDCKTQFAN